MACVSLALNGPTDANSAPYGTCPVRLLIILRSWSLLLFLFTLPFGGRLGRPTAHFHPSSGTSASSGTSSGRQSTKWSSYGWMQLKWSGGSIKVNDRVSWTAVTEDFTTRVNTDGKSEF
jgi:hypothetical protein